MYIGIDLGTSAVKTVLFDDRQRVVASAGRALAVSRPHPGWSEQNPDDWQQAAFATLDALAASHPGAMAKVRGLGLSGQQHGATLLDDAGQPLRPALLWNDSRAGAECVEIETACPDSRKLSGNIAMAGFTAPKVLWVRKHEPQVFARTAKVLLPKDYLRLCLTGEYISDLSDASGTLWLDVPGRTWSDALLDATHMRREQMPALVDGSEAAGRIRPELCSRWGFTDAPTVAGGGGDNAAAACGLGVVRPNTASLSIGTSGVLFVSNDAFAPNTDGAVHAFCHALPDTWHQMGVILAAADSLEWLAQLLGTPAPDLVAELGDRVDGPSPAQFAPYLSGERTPHNDPRVRGALFNIDQRSDRKTLAHAVLDGVAYAFKDCQQALTAAGSDFAEATAVGGGARSRLWLTIIASLLERPLRVPDDNALGAALGAARLAVCAAENADPFEVCTPPDGGAVIEPNAELGKRYLDGYRRYRALYASLTPHY